jgi:probable F420-dependent oxidoreductase
MPGGTPSRTLQLSVTAEGAMYPPDQQHRLLELAREADRLGVDCIDVTDHVLIGQGALRSGMGWEPHHLDLLMTEPLTTLAAMAGATQRIKLVSSVVIAPLRPAGLLAKTAATLHALSRGRFVMGVSVSWHKDEYDALGVPFARRGQILDDQLAACRLLWTTAPASFHSKTVNFDAMHCSPRPGPTERIPIWFGGQFTPKLIRRVTTLGDGWLLYGGLGLSLEQKKKAIATLKEHCAAAGRPPDTLELCDEVRPIESSVERTVEQIPALVEAGVTNVRMHLRRFSKSPDDVLDALEEIVRRVEPFRALRV